MVPKVPIDISQNCGTYCDDICTSGKVAVIIYSGELLFVGDFFSYVQLMKHFWRGM